MKRKRIETLTKDPNDLLDYTVDWARWLHRNGGDTIVSVDWILDPGIGMAYNHHTDERATVWISGGVAGNRYRVTCRITTQKGRIKDKSFILKITDQ